MKTINPFRSRIYRAEPGKPAGKPILKYLSWLACIALVLLLIGGCAPCYYSPGAQNVPLLNEAGECKATAGVKFGQYSIGLDIQSSAALTNHMGIMLNYSTFVGQDSHLSDEYESTSHSRMIEGGMGYFLPFRDSFIFETYAGYSYAKIKSDYNQTLGVGNSKLYYSSFFLQPAVGYCKEHIEIALSARFRVLDFTRYTCDDNTGGYLEQSLQEIKDNPPACLIEPALTIRVGGERIKFQFQAGYSAFLNVSSQVEHDPLNLNFGLIAVIHGGED